MASSVLLICTLALLATANAELCNTDHKGILHADPIHLNDVTVPGGTYNVNLPNACSQFGPNYKQVGTQVTACTFEGGSPSITLITLNTASVFSDFGARVSSTIYCSNLYLAEHATAHVSAGRPYAQ